VDSVRGAAAAAVSRDSDVRVSGALVRRDPRAAVAPVYREVSDAAADGAAAADG
jgi:hypothetical protein